MIKLNNTKIIPSSFPDGTLSMRIDGMAFCHSVITITWKYESDAEMATLYYLAKYIMNHPKRHKLVEGVGRVVIPVELYLPYIPNARMDRVKESDEIFTLKYFAEFINSLGFDKVFVLDPHSSVSTALIDNVVVDNGLGYINKTYKDVESFDPILFFPDEGAMKRYSSAVALPYAFGVKTRDWRSGEILGLDIVNGDIVKGRNVLIIDDICSRGGTFYHSALALKDVGAEKIFLHVTHCENTIFDGKLVESDLIEHIYTTDSIFNRDYHKITVWDCEE